MAGLALFIIGFVVGKISPDLHALKPDKPQPRSPVLWTSRVEQFQMLPINHSNPVVVLLGDSITDWMMSEEFDFSDIYRVYNRGINGDTIMGVQSRLQQSLPPQTVHCFLLVGFNDLILGVSPEEAAEELDQVCLEILDRIPGVLVLETLPENGGKISGKVKRFNGLLRQNFSTRARIRLLDLQRESAAWYQAGHPGPYADQVHLNGYGSLLRMRLIAIMLDNLAVPGRTQSEKVVEG